MKANLQRVKALRVASPVVLPPQIVSGASNEDFLNLFQSDFERSRKIPLPGTLPEGSYIAEVLRSGVKPTKDSKGLHLCTKLLVLYPEEYYGAEIYSNIYVMNPNSSMKHLHMFCENLGTRIRHITELRQLCSRIQGWRLDVELYRSNGYENVNIQGRVEAEEPDGPVEGYDDGDDHADDDDGSMSEWDGGDVDCADEDEEIQ
jgi:hypothetical protein